MKYVALLSGGKDSCYNLLHCHKNGHELVAAASLGPQPGTDELDSYMYQTVGQDAIEYVARALDVPLYRRVISGSAVNLGSEYGSRRANLNGALDGDETEDLYGLLADVKNAHPGIQGVSVGAILSNYQRVRVEHVCRRLSLTPLCYLWQRDQRELLSEMISAGLEAILIKVAGVGLTARHLGQNLAQMQSTLLSLNDRYGSHVCGEGGEYETLTLNSPLFKRRIKIIETETVIHSDNDFASVAYLRIKHAELENKEAQIIDPSIPPLLEEKYTDLQASVTHSLQATADGECPEYDLDAAVYFFPSSVKSIGPWVAATIHPSLLPDASTQSIESVVNDCFQRLQSKLQEYDLDMSHCVNINLLIASMDDFQRVNAVYTKYFGASPAARACIGVNMMEMRVSLDCLAYAEQNASDRQALHVQGLSYWAPANIGPYSQAITVQERRIFVSGQIGLLPHSLSLPSPQSLALETALACQHVNRVAGALNVPGTHVQLSIYWLQYYKDLDAVRNAVKEMDKHAAVVFAGVASLPKGALIEKQVILHTGKFTVIVDEEEETQMRTPNVTSGNIPGPAFRVQWTRSSFIHSACPITVIFVKGEVDEAATSQVREQLSDVWENALSVRMLYRPSSTISDIPAFRPDDRTPVLPIPCHFVASATHDDWDMAICILGA